MKPPAVPPAETGAGSALGHVYAVLVRPSDPRNIGFACRALKTMGITRLRIASSHMPNLRRASVTAVHAKEILDPNEVYPTLPDALTDVSLAAGVTRRRGKMRKSHVLLPEEFAERAIAHGRGKVAIVFGTEEYGLTDEELSACHCAVTIPSSPLFPSLNLSHAVQIIASALFREAEKHRIRGFQALDGQSLEILVSGIIANLRPLNYFKLDEAKSLTVLLRDVFARAALSKGEARRIETIFHKINGLFIRQARELRSSKNHDEREKT
jgi:tRNA/rRNA methyltransferase